MKQRGDELRDTLSELLKYQFSFVEIEGKVGNKCADILYVDDTHPLMQLTIAIECKDWASPPDSSQLRSIYHDYFPAIQNGEIDYLFIIGRSEIGREPRNTLKSLSKTKYLTFDDFVRSMMNFSYLVNDNIVAFRNHDASSNYISPRIAGEDVAADQKVREWLRGSENVLLIYGGYGIGKTSFSFQMTADLSRDYKSADFSRIPIRISLGDLYYKQDLKSLIASNLSGADGAASVRNFTYNLFLEMARRGYFLIILDGFDEMRHAMDVSDFEYTFSEMSALFKGDSKVVILGRPDSFFTDEEEDRVIKAVLGGRSAYSKIELAMWDVDQVETYITGCINGGMIPFADEAEKTALVALKDKVIENEFDVISRPVQLKMFTTLMREFLGGDAEFNRYDLYFKFIYDFARREDAKASRKFTESRDWKYGYSDPRTVFMQNIAWWVLTEKKENRFFPKDIPFELLPKELREKSDRDAALREIILGSVVEPELKRVAPSAVEMKGFRSYYFPHKSYIEFLVAEYFCRAKFSREMYVKFFEVANYEILTFVEEGPAESTANLREGLEHARGLVSPRVFDIAARDPKIALEKDRMMEGKASIGRLYVFYHWLLRSNRGSAEVEAFLFAALASASNFSRCAAAYAMAFDHLGRFNSPDFCKKLIVHCLEKIGPFSFQKMIQGEAASYSRDIQAMHMLICSEALSIGRGKISIDINIGKSVCKSECRSFVYDMGLDSISVADCRVYKFGEDVISALKDPLHKILSFSLRGDILDLKYSLKA